MRRSRPALLVLALAAWTIPARANGRFPSAQHVVLGPGSSSQIIALRSTFGLLLSRDGGQRFTWMCEEAMLWPAAPPATFDPPVELSERGVVFAGLTGLRHTPDGCLVDDLIAARNVTIADLTAHPTTGELYAIEATPGAANGVYRATADARRFERAGAGVEGIVFDTIEVAPSAPQRLYLTGRERRMNRPRFFRSDDGGATLTQVDSNLVAIDSAWVSGVDARAPDTLFVRASVGAGAELWRSNDGARTFRRLLATPDPMLGFALADNGRDVWVGGVTSGLLRSDDGGDSFRRVNALPVLCLRHHAGALWACSDGAAGTFALGRSTDGGARFEAILRFEDATRLPGAASCAPPTAASAVCVDRWPALRAELSAAAPVDASVPRDVNTRIDAAAPPPPPLPRGSCSVTAPRAATPPLALVLAAALGLCRTRRRARGAHDEASG